MNEGTGGFELRLMDFLFDCDIFARDSLTVKVLNSDVCTVLVQQMGFTTHQSQSHHHTPKCQHGWTWRPPTQTFIRQGKSAAKQRLGLTMAALYLRMRSPN
jgi:hypothetical protein